MLLFLWAVVLGMKQTVANMKNAQVTPSVSVTVTPENSPLATPLPTPDAGETATGAYQLPINKKIPILMYHYIREYSDPKDKLGVNLSVSPAHFTAQMTAIKEAGYTPITFTDLNKPLPEKPLILSFDDGYLDAYTGGLPILQQFKVPATFYIITDFLDKPNYMSTEQVKALDAAGMEIASHTLDHKSLDKLGEADQRREMAESKAQLESLLGKPVVHFCYPSGRYDQTSIALAKELGYRTATTTKPGVPRGNAFNTNPYELTRIRVFNDTNISHELSKY